MHIDRDTAYTFSSPNQKLNLSHNINQGSRSRQKNLDFQNTLPYSRYNAQSQNINSIHRSPQQNGLFNYLNPNHKQMYSYKTNPLPNNSRIIKTSGNASPIGMTYRTMPVYQQRPQSTMLYRPLRIISPVKAQVVNLLPLNPGVMVAQNYIPAILVPNNTYLRPDHQIICRNLIKSKICSNSFCPYQQNNQKNQLTFTSDLDIRYRNVMGKNYGTSKPGYDFKNSQLGAKMIYNKYDPNFKPVNRSTFKSISQYNPQIITNIKNLIKQDGLQIKQQSGSAVPKSARSNLSSFEKGTNQELQNLKKQQVVQEQKSTVRHLISDVNSKNDKESITYELDYKNIVNSDYKEQGSQLKASKFNNQLQRQLNSYNNKKQLKDTKYKQKQPQNKRNTKRKHK